MKKSTWAVMRFNGSSEGETNETFEGDEQKAIERFTWHLEGSASPEELTLFEGDNERADLAKQCYVEVESRMDYDESAHGFVSRD